MSGYIRDGKGGALITCRVSPGSSKTSLSGHTEEFVRMKIAAPPVEGKANKELIRFFSKLFKRPKSAVEIVKGETGKLKTVLVRGISAGEALELMKEKK